MSRSFLFVELREDFAGLGKPSAAVVAAFDVLALPLVFGIGTLLASIVMPDQSPALETVRRRPVGIVSPRVWHTWDITQHVSCSFELNVTGGHLLNGEYGTIAALPDE